MCVSVFVHSTKDGVKLVGKTKHTLESSRDGMITFEMVSVLVLLYT